MKTILLDYRIALLTALTLGLAPFNEPHIWGKILWIKGGAIGMKSMDWFDTFLHGLPWIWLIVAVTFLIKNSLSKKKINS